MTLAWELENDASGPVYFSFPNTSLRASFSFPLAFARILRSAAGSSTRRNCSSASASWRTLSSSLSLMPVTAISVSYSEKSSDTRHKEYRVRRLLRRSRCAWPRTVVGQLETRNAARDRRRSPSPTTTDLLVAARRDGESVPGSELAFRRILLADRPRAEELWLIAPVRT